MSLDGAFFPVKLQKKALLTVPNSSLWKFMHVQTIFDTSPRMLYGDELLTCGDGDELLTCGDGDGDELLTQF